MRQDQKRSNEKCIVDLGYNFGGVFNNPGSSLDFKFTRLGEKMYAKIAGLMLCAVLLSGCLMSVGYIEPYPTHSYWRGNLHYYQFHGVWYNHRRGYNARGRHGRSHRQSHRRRSRR